MCKKSCENCGRSKECGAYTAEGCGTSLSMWIPTESWQIQIRRNAKSVFA